MGCATRLNWINLPTSVLDSDRFVGSDPVERGTWLCLMRYCVGQENGGEIVACKDWPDRKWQQLCRITKDEVDRKSQLWFWNGNSLRVWAYPVDNEAEFQKRRAQARKAAQKRWKK